MTDLSNLYVEKINSEHPLAVWILNEDIDYVSKITESQRQLYNASNWSPTNATVILESNPPGDTPFSNSATSRIEGTVPSGPTQDIQATSLFEVPISSLSTDLANFSLSFHLYTISPYATNIAFGFKYYDPFTTNTKEVLVSESITQEDVLSWKFLAHTFGLNQIPSNAEDVYFIIRISTVDGGGAGDYDFLINGITLGQWSEEFHKTSLGQVPVPLPSDIALTANMQVMPAFPYGSSNLNGYYTACENDRMIYSVNFGIPLVYGSSNSTKIYPHQHTIDDELVTFPSLIFPGYGFMNDSGKYNEYTAEMWVRLNADSSLPRKIFGPIAGNDGLYAEGPFLTFVFNRQYRSHYVGEWYRPMLIHIRIVRDNATVLVNGEEVISLNYLDQDLVLPSRLDEDPDSATFGKSQDYLGFYAYEEIRPIEIDSFAIYSYPVPTEVAKRRFVWGQGVVAPETTNSALNAVTAFNDYTFSKYAANYNYPDMANWRQAYFSNVETNLNSLRLPNYRLPDFSLDGLTTQKLFDDLQSLESAVEDKYFTFRPDSSWDNKNTYIYFKELGILSETVRTFYVVAESNGSATNQPIFKIINKVTKDYLLCKVNNTTVTYSVSIGGTVSTIATKTITANQKFTVGINIPALSLTNIPGINRLFNNQSSVDVYVAGDTVTAFTGKIFRVGFNSSYNNRKIHPLYDSSGIFNVNSTTATAMMSHIANYTLKAYDKYGIFFADIASAGYWEDYAPLSYFGKTVDNFEGQKFYDLSSIQLNLDYPEPLEINSLETISSWNYLDLKIRYQLPAQQDYATLSNNFYSGWDDYEDMSQDSQKYYYYNTLQNSIRSYVSFQDVSKGANKNLVEFDNFAVARVKGVVDPAIEPTPWETTAYEVVDGSIIYPPKTDQSGKSVNFNKLAMVYHLDIESDGILHKPIRFRDLQLSSQVLERAIFTEIGTKFGTPVYPYRKLGLYYDLNGQNPISTYKESTPHLFMTRHSGWRVRGDFTQPAANQLAVIASASGDGTTITYVGSNSFIPGQKVTITGLTTSFGDSLNLVDQVVTAANSSGFTVSNSTIGIAIGPGIATAILEGSLIVDRGISIPVNQQRGLETEISAVQLWLRFSERVFPNQEIPIFSIEYKTGAYNFFLKEDESSQRGFIVCRDRATNQIVSGLAYFVNGKPVDVPYINNEEWGVLGVSFATPLDFSQFTGRINLNGPLTYNNVSYYLSTNLEQQQRLTARSWARVKEDSLSNPILWSYWDDFSWSEIKIISSTGIYAIDPSEIYARYVGTNRVVVDDETDGVLFDPERIRVYNKLDWISSIKIPV
jgi:hypothetical protein